jgi:hypothetical protein
LAGQLKGPSLTRVCAALSFRARPPVAKREALTWLIAAPSVPAVSRSTYRLAVCALAAVFVGLMSLHMTDRWQYRHEDNGAWFSAVARTHVRAGLAATRGQDFFQYRATGELKPYLHHPPLLGLYLAAVFKLTGTDTPAVARGAMMAVHFCSFIVFALLVKQIFPASSEPRLWALMVFAISPMSVFFGRTPSHEPLGLCFVLLGAYICSMVVEGKWKGRAWLYVAGAAWVLAVFSAWHAAFCVLGLAPYLLRHRRDTAHGYAGMALVAVPFAAAAAALHLLWANHGHLEVNALPAAGYWVGVRLTTAGMADYAHSIFKAVAYATEYCGYVPAALAGVWLVGVVRRRLRGRPLADRDFFVLCLAVGSWIFSLIFNRAVGRHVYHQFYLLPSIALASAAVIESLLRGEFFAHHRRAAIVATVLAASLTVVGCAGVLAGVYRQPYEYAVKATEGIEQEFY